MATRGNIGYKTENGEYKFIYTHWDGYILENGLLLFRHYTDFEKIKLLVDQGDISSLSHNCDGGMGHSFDEPLSKQTTYYGRDRGEQNTEPKITKNRDDIYANEFAYVWEDDHWLCIGGRYDEWVYLEKAIDIEMYS